MTDSPLRATIERVLESSKLVEAVQAKQSRRLHITMRGNSHAFADFDPNAEARVALLLGVYRAHLVRYMATRGLGQSFLRELRKQHGVSPLRRQHDTQLALEHVPDFSAFVCDPPLTDDEILDAACKEYRDIIAGPGTEYHDYRHRNINNVTLADSDTGSSTVPVAADAYDEIRALQTEEHPLGPAYSRAAAIAFDLYGQSAMYWLAQKFIFGKEFTPMLKALADVDRKVDEKRYWQAMNDVQRKLPKMDERITEALRNDPLMKTLYEEYFGFAPAPVEAPVYTDLQDERIRYTERLEARLRKALAHEGATTAQIDQVLSLTPNRWYETLRSFAAVEHKPVEMRQFLRGLLKRQNAATRVA
jgi:hypothetical protein